MKTIAEKNRIIAEFMGVTPDKDGRYEIVEDFDIVENIEAYEAYDGIRIIEGGYVITKFSPEQMRYHTSWDWLMPVVEKIETLELDGGWSIKPMSIRIDAGSSEIMVDNGVSDYISNDGQYFHAFKIETGGTKKENTYNAVVQFIEWFNDNK